MSLSSFERNWYIWAIKEIDQIVCKPDSSNHINYFLNLKKDFINIIGEKN